MSAVNVIFPHVNVKNFINSWGGNSHFNVKYKVKL